MTLLTTLTERLERLPERRRLKMLVGKMTGFNDKLTLALGQFAEAETQEELVRIVFSEESTSGVAPKRKKAASTARRLFKKLSADIDKVQEPRSYDDVTAIIEQADSSRQAVRDRCQSLMTKKLAPYMKVVAVASDLKLSGAEELSDVMRKLKENAAQPPSRVSEAKTIGDRLDELRRAVQHLGIDDEVVRKFLIDAAAGNAGLKVPIEQESLRVFLDKHNLWTLFRVCTR